MFLFYIATGISSMVLFGQAAKGQGTAAILANIARHPAMMRVNALLTLLTFVDAVALAVALYALTRDQDRDLALLALCFRFAEGVVAAVSAVRGLGLLSVATASIGLAAPDAAAANALGNLLLKQGGWTGTIGATCFALGSTLYCYLFVRARSIPAMLAWLGVFASALLVVALPAQLLGLLRGPVTWLIWLPMLAFEVPLGVWLLVKGTASRPGTIG
jgi:hypothetical protein